MLAQLGRNSSGPKREAMKHPKNQMPIFLSYTVYGYQMFSRLSNNIHALEDNKQRRGFSSNLSPRISPEHYILAESSARMPSIYHTYIKTRSQGSYLQPYSYFVLSQVVSTIHHVQAFHPTSCSSPFIYFPHRRRARGFSSKAAHC